MNEEEIKKEQPKAEQKDEVKNEGPKAGDKNILPKAPKMREIIIQTDGNRVAIVKNESSGALELMSILNALLQSIAQR